MVGYPGARPGRDAPVESSDPGRGARRIQRVGWATVGVSLLVVGYMGYQVFVTSWLAQANQAELTAAAQQRFAEVEVAEVPYSPPLDADPAPEPLERVTKPIVATTTEPQERSLLVEAPPALSEAFAIVSVPSLQSLAAGWTVVEGVGVEDLKTGAGHIPSTAMPGMPGNAVISGHRTSYGAPFNELDLLRPGDLIEVSTATGVHSYVVRESIVVTPFELWVTDPRQGAWLTLTTCNPQFSSKERLVVFAELADGPNKDAIYG